MISFSHLSHRPSQSPALKTCSTPNALSSITVHQGSAFKRVATVRGGDPLFFPQRRHSLCCLIDEAVTFVITGLVIEAGEPTTFSRLESRSIESKGIVDLKKSKRAISFLFSILDAIGTGLIHRLVVRHGIPQRVLIEPEPSS